MRKWIVRMGGVFILATIWVLLLVSPAIAIPSPQLSPRPTANLEILASW